MVASQISGSGLCSRRFWFRDNGFSSKLTKILPYAELSASEKLLACILRDDSTDACLLLRTYQVPAEVSQLQDEQQKQSVFVDLLRLIFENQMARLVLDRLFDADLLQFVPQEFRAELTAMSLQETAFQKVVGKRFSELLVALSALDQHHLWIKGVSLSRRVYSDINHRHYGDLDLVVRREKLVETFDLLIKLGFACHISPAFCNQVGVGPISSIEDLLLSPHPELIPASALSLYKADWPMIDIKLAPFDRGIQMLEIERLFDEAETLTCCSEKFFAPSLVDHLMISVHNLIKDRTLSWKNLYDVHLLATKLNDDPTLWYIFVGRCKRESIESPAWLALSLAAERLSTSVPDVVLTRLYSNTTPWKQQIALAVSPFFVWNATSLLMMVSNASVSSDCNRKFKILAESVFPSREFLSAYYNKNQPITKSNVLPNLILHWIVLLLPGGVVRMIMRNLWSNTLMESAPQASPQTAN